MRFPRLMVLAVTVMAIAVPVGSLMTLRHLRQRQFDKAKDFVASHGGSLSFDLVDGNYMLELTGDAASNDTIRSILPTLRALPTGFTWLGPGETRLFWVTIANGSITDDGVAALSQLRISWLAVSGGSLTDRAVGTLINMDDLSGIMLSSVGLTDQGVAELRSGKGRATITIDGQSRVPNNQTKDAGERG